MGAGAGASAASATVAEAAKRTAQAIFFISIPGCGGGLATVETARRNGGEEEGGGRGERAGCFSRLLAGSVLPSLCLGMEATAGPGIYRGISGANPGRSRVGGGRQPTAMWRRLLRACMCMGVRPATSGRAVISRGRNERVVSCVVCVSPLNESLVLRQARTFVRVF